MQRELFDSGWEYAEGAPFFGMLVAPTTPVHLPHDASIGKPRRAEYPSGRGGGYAWAGVLSYRKRFHAPLEWQGQSVQLEFEGVMMHAEVLLNGNLLALHPYGYTSFVVDLTGWLQYGAENDLVVIANTSAQPNSRWYTGAGIYRHVWLRTGGQIHIPVWGVFVNTPEVHPETATIAIATEIANPGTSPATIRLRSQISDPHGNRVAQIESEHTVGAATIMTASQALPIADPLCWSITSPDCYTLQSELLIDANVIDQEQTSFGIRTITIDPLNGLRLNGEALKLKGGCIHHDHGLLGAASFDRAEQRKVELLKAAGFNAVRCAHNPPAPALLEACDRLGMLVINESFDVWRVAKSTNDYHLYFEEWWQRDLEAMVKRDRNHPALIMWSIGNEIVECQGHSDGDAWSQRQAAYVRSLDPTRLVTQGMRILFEEFITKMFQGAPEASIDAMGIMPVPDPNNDPWGDRTEAFVAPLDVVGYNYMTERYDYDAERFPERIICGTETWPRYAFESWQAMLNAPAAIGDFVWTALDYLGESGIGQVAIDAPLTAFESPFPYHIANCGDFDICGFKRPQSLFRDILWGVRSAPVIMALDPQHFGKTIRYSAWGWEPVIESWTFPGQEGQATRVEIYSADDQVELLLNGHSLGRQPAGASQKNKATFEVVYEPGTLEAIGYRNGRVTQRSTLATSGTPAALRLTPDRSTIHASYGDLSYIAVEVVDAAGAPVRHVNPLISVDVQGAGTLLAIGSANPTSEELYVGNQRSAYEGRLMLVVTSSGQPGSITISAQADGLATTTLALTVPES